LSQSGSKMLSTLLLNICELLFRGDTIKLNTSHQVKRYRIICLIFPLDKNRIYELFSLEICLLSKQTSQSVLFVFPQQMNNNTAVRGITKCFIKKVVYEFVNIWNFLLAHLAREWRHLLEPEMELGLAGDCRQPGGAPRDMPAKAFQISNLLELQAAIPVLANKLLSLEDFSLDRNAFQGESCWRFLIRRFKIWLTLSPDELQNNQTIRSIT